MPNLSANVYIFKIFITVLGKKGQFVSFCSLYQQKRGSRPWLTWQACSGLLEETGLGPNELFVKKNGVWNSENHLNILNYSKTHFIFFVHHISLHCRCSDRPLRWFLNHGNPHPEVIARCWRCCDGTHWWMSCRTVGTLSSMDWDET